MTHCLQNPATFLSINKLYHSYKSQGLTVSKNSLYSFMHYLEDAYCIFSIPAFNLSSRKSEGMPKKIYPVDPGLITAYAIDRSFLQGPALESLVFSILLRRSHEMYTYTTRKGNEVDFFVILPEQTTYLFQVSTTLKQEETRKRKIGALDQAMQELDLKRSFLVTLEEEETIESQGRTVEVLPLLKFLMTT